jgi:single-strand DNA-binding protein
MSIGFNKVIILGYLGHDPEIRYTKSGIAVTTLNVAVSENRKNKDEWTLQTDWFNVICLGKTAENVGKFLKKGQLLLVDGKLQNRLWENKSGNKNIITEIITKQIIFLGKRNTEEKNTSDIDNVNTQKKKIDDHDDVPF